MSGKGLTRLAILVFTSLLGAGLTLGALRAPAVEAPQAQSLR
jgi:hypothetical protein